MDGNKSPRAHPSTKHVVVYGMKSKPRAREQGIVIGLLQPGPQNAITDVSGVRVGHSTLIQGDKIRTGITCVLPHAGNLFKEKVPGAVFTGNGFGKIMGSTQVNELGEIETPILLTSTLNVGKVADGLIDYMLALPGNESVRSINPLVAETNDGFLNDVRSRPLGKEHVLEAIENAAKSNGGRVEEGCIGAGAGTVCFGYKGGIGTSSRILELPNGQRCTVGVLVQSNFGGELTIAGVPIERRMKDKKRFDKREKTILAPPVIATTSAAYNTILPPTLSPIVSTGPISPTSTSPPTIVGSAPSSLTLPLHMTSPTSALPPPPHPISATSTPIPTAAFVGGMTMRPTTASSAIPRASSQDIIASTSGPTSGSSSAIVRSTSSIAPASTSSSASTVPFQRAAPSMAQTSPPATNNSAPMPNKSPRGPALLHRSSPSETRSGSGSSGGSGPGSAPGPALLKLKAHEHRADVDGSCVIVIATDAALDQRLLERLGVRAMMGMGRVGAAGSNGSGDYVIAFSTAPSGSKIISNDASTLVFQAVIDATEEAIVNSLFMAKDTSSNGKIVEAIPVDKIMELLRWCHAVHT